MRNLSVREEGDAAAAKVLAQRVARRLGLDPLRFKRHVAALRIIADAPGGVVTLDPAARGAP